MLIKPITLTIVSDLKREKSLGEVDLTMGL